MLITSRRDDRSLPVMLFTGGRDAERWEDEHECHEWQVLKPPEQQREQASRADRDGKSVRPRA